MMSGPDAVLCYSCEKKLSSVESLEAKLVIAKKAVMDFLILACLQRESESRRSAISSAPPAKRPCLSLETKVSRPLLNKWLNGLHLFFL